MANWSGLILTAAGQQLEAEMRAGQRLINFTKMKIGSGLPTNNVEHMTDLVSPEKEIPLSGKRVVSNTMLQLTAILTNTDVTEGFTVNELGVYANDSKNSSYKEILYGVIIDPKGDYLSAAGGSLAESLIFNVLIGTSNATNITATLNPDGLLTVEQLNDAMNLHNTSTTAHTELFTTDSTPATDAGTTSSLISKLGARVKWVKNYVTNKITDALKVVDQKITDAFKTDDFDTNVIRAIGKKTFNTLGVYWSFTNPNAWYICFGPIFGRLIIQGGFVTYTNTPNAQAINPPLKFKTYLWGGIHDIGITWATGGTYGAIDYNDGVLSFRPLYSGNPQDAAKNGVNMRYILFTLA
nr:MAG TPA: tail collar fiber protein [Caudoviricetes sp.]